MKLKIHAIAGTIALLTIFTFWTSTIASELFGSYAQIITVKTVVLWGMLIRRRHGCVTGQGLETARAGTQIRAHENHRGQRYPDPDA